MRRRRLWATAGLVFFAIVGSGYLAISRRPADDLKSIKKDIVWDRTFYYNAEQVRQSNSPGFMPGGMVRRYVNLRRMTDQEAIEIVNKVATPENGWPKPTIQRMNGGLYVQVNKKDGSTFGLAQTQDLAKPNFRRYEPLPGQYIIEETRPMSLGEQILLKLKSFKGEDPYERGRRATTDIKYKIGSI